MTDNNRPITPPRELVAKWITEGRRQGYFGRGLAELVQGRSYYVAAQSAQWGYEQRGAVNEAELQNARDEEREACCKWVAWVLRCKGLPFQWSDVLRDARRPEPPSLKEQALTALERWAEDEYGPGAVFHKGLEVGLIRRALEALDD